MRRWFNRYGLILINAIVFIISVTVSFPYLYFFFLCVLRVLSWTFPFPTFFPACVNIVRKNFQLAPMNLYWLNDKSHYKKKKDESSQVKSFNYDWFCLYIDYCFINEVFIMVSVCVRADSYSWWLFDDSAVIFADVVNAKSIN